MRLFDGLSHKELAEWHKQLARLSSALRSESFCSVLVETLGKLINFQGVVIITYKNNHRPISIYDSYLPSEHKQVVVKYLDGVYALDPFYTALNRHIAPGVYRLKEMAPDSFEQSDYYLQYYRGLNNIDDEVGLFIDLPDDVVMIISLARISEMESLTRSERNVLNSIFPLIRSLVREFWALQSVKFVSGADDADPVEKAFKTFGSGTLTERELEIISLILQGHSSKSVASSLGITPGTVKVHRKNIYTRLNVSTQSQLFSLFLNHLAMEASME
ncbi:helix-turn-helix transcriptional regulator [Amphritea balenae]|uniref:LuxR family transcriptional regulator n=1 Tax=Amphritea balenae TaxID=452629 RepID=A0A3P1SWA1_9GAMM|nr:helix-turn-helix transcriptional regulator [Amphritea balenae]RRD01487.1 LuxR family transcriptional regulator [Amphritea balenae]GGK56646.1 helix-turn-helix transcriptional regulator [Amphritea balenae]